MILTIRHWVFIGLVSVALHLGLAGALASFAPEPDPGAIAHGVGGVEVGLGHAGSTYSPPAPRVIDKVKPVVTPSPTLVAAVTKAPKAKSRSKPKAKAKPKPKQQKRPRKKVRPKLKPRPVKQKPKAKLQPKHIATVVRTPAPVIALAEAASIPSTLESAVTPAPTPPPTLSEERAQHAAVEAPASKAPSKLSSTNKPSYQPSASASQKTTATGEARRQKMGGKAGDPSLYFSKLLAELNRHKRYPVRAKRRKEEGVVMVALSIARNGSIIATSIRDSSGHPNLDRAALDLVTESSPLPSVPESLPQDPLELVIPIEYSLITNSH